MRYLLTYRPGRTGWRDRSISRSSGEVQSGGFSRNRPQARQHFFPVKIYNSSLIVLARMDMNSGCAALEEIRKDLHVKLRIGAHGPAVGHFFKRHLSFGAVLNGLGIANVEIGFPGLRTETPELRSFI